MSPPLTRPTVRLLALPFGSVRKHPGLAAQFVASSLGRAALTGAAILLVRDFLGGVLGRENGLARRLTESYGAGAALWGVAAALIITQIGAAILAYSAQVSQQPAVENSRDAPILAV